MADMFVVSFHLGFFGCISSFLHPALCFKVLISLVLGSLAGFGNLDEFFHFRFSCVLSCCSGADESVQSFFGGLSTFPLGGEINRAALLN